MQIEIGYSTKGKECDKLWIKSYEFINIVRQQIILQAYKNPHVCFFKNSKSIRCFFPYQFILFSYFIFSVKDFYRELVLTKLYKRK